MKKWIAWILALVCLLTLAGCRAGRDRDNAGEEETGEIRGQETPVLNDKGTQAEDAQIESAVISVARVYDTSETGAALSLEDVDRIADLLEEGSWNTEGTADCLNDCILTVNGESVYYHSDCGTFNDTIQERCLSLTEEERAAVNAVLSKYITLGFEETVDETWGLTLSVRDVTPTGLTLMFTQSGGTPTGELQTGSPFGLEKYVDGVWEAVAKLPLEDGVEWAWTGEAYLIPMNDSMEREVTWEYLYGALPAGTYRIGKEIMDFRGTGDYDERDYYAEFTITDS